MKKTFISIFTISSFILSLAIVAPNMANAATVGSAAPEFKAMDSNAKEFKLSDQKGKIVVLEWTNHKCPFVKKHYETNNMQKLQADYTAKDVVWVSIISSAPGKQGYLESGKEANQNFADRKSAPSYIIRDDSGKIGKMYKAATTPHMYIVDAEGNLAYQGAIDSIPTASGGDVAKATNYVSTALDELIAGKPVSKPVTSSYGWSVKY